MGRDTDEDIREWLVGRSRVSIGRYTYGHRALRIYQWKEGAALRVGQFCSLARGINIYLGGNHRTDWISTFPFGHVHGDALGGRDIKGHPTTRGDVQIGNDVWIGSDATILSGVTIGDGAVIGAHAVVARDVPPYAIVGGNPGTARALRFGPEIMALLLELAWWDLPDEAIREIVPVLSAPPSVEVLRGLVARYRPEAREPVAIVR